MRRPVTFFPPWALWYGISRPVLRRFDNLQATDRSSRESLRATLAKDMPPVYKRIIRSTSTSLHDLPAMPSPP